MSTDSLLGIVILSAKERPPGKACKGECRGAAASRDALPILWMPLAGVCEVALRHMKRKQTAAPLEKPLVR